MKTRFLNLKTICLMLAITTMTTTFVSCSDDDDKELKTDKSDDPIVDNSAKGHYVLLSTTSPRDLGYMSAYDKIPSGEIETNIKENSLNVMAMGFYSHGKYIFKRIGENEDANSATGMQRYSVDNSGKLIKDGFIASSTNMYVHNENIGYYFDEIRGLLKLQTFNPSTMQRTGEIDLSILKDTNFEYNAIGNLLVSKGNKLFVGITRGSAKGKGMFFFDPAKGFTELAIIDIPTSKYEKTIRTDKVSDFGYPASHNQMWTLGDDGALYLCYHGLSPKGASSSAIMRVKKDATDFDSNFIIKADDYTVGTTFGTVAVKNGKLYTAIGSNPINFKTMTTDDSYKYVAFDLNNISTPKNVAGLPNTVYAFFNGGAIQTINNELYFNVFNTSGDNGYYKLNGDKVEKVFSVKEGGRIYGFTYIK